MHRAHRSSRLRLLSLRVLLSLLLVTPAMTPVVPAAAAAPPGASDAYALSNVIIEGHVGGRFTDSRVIGSTMYAATVSGLQVLDVSDPASPTVVADYALPWTSQSIELAGDFAYIAGQADFAVFDVSTPASPSLLGTCEIESGGSDDMRVTGTRAIVVGQQRMCVVDVSEPSSPSQTYNVNLFTYAMGIELAGDHAFVADWSGNKFSVVDVSAGATPSLAATRALEWASDVDVVDGRAYVAAGRGMAVYDVSTPTDPTLISAPDDNYNGFNYVSIEGTAAYLVSNDWGIWSDGLYVYDVTDFANPVMRVEHLDSGQFDVQAVGSTLFARTDAGFAAYDVTTPDAPVAAGGYQGIGMVYDAVMDGSNVYMADDRYGLLIADISDPSAPAMVGGLRSPGYSYSVAADGALACLGAGDTGGILVTVDVSDPASPTELGQLDLGDWDSAPESLEMTGSYALLGTYGTGLRIVSLADPANPSEIRSVPVTGACWNIALGDGVAYVDHDNDDQSGVAIVDISDPANASVVGEIRIPNMWGSYNDIRGVYAEGDRLYVSAHNTGVVVFDATDPANPVEIGSTNDSSRPGRLAVRNGRAYAFSGDYWMPVYDVTDPATSVPLIGGADRRDSVWSAGDFTDGGAYGEDGFFWVSQCGLTTAVYRDITPPTVTIDGVYEGDAYRWPVNAYVDIEGTNIETQSVTLDGQPYESGTEISAEGTHTVAAYARKASGVEASASVTFLLDMTAPVASVSGVQDGRWYETSVSPTYQISDAHLSDTEATLDGQPWTSGAPISQLGTHTAYVYGEDSAGNWAEQEVTFVIRDPAAPPDTERHSGDSRFDTAVALSQATFPDRSVGTVVIATGYNYPDALAGAPLAHAFGSPILLVERDDVPDAVMAEIERLGAYRAIILGSSSVVSDAVKTQLEAITTGGGGGPLPAAGPGSFTVERIAGDDRYHTARLIAERLRAEKGHALGTAFIATGDNYPDALAGAGIAAYVGAPILLTRKDSLPPHTSEALTAVGSTNTVVLGSRTVVSDAVKNSLPDATRLGGTDRYDTARLIAEYALGHGFYEQEVLVATGANFPDALAAGALCAARRAPAILVTTTLPQASRTYVLDHRTAIWRVTAAGGSTVVSQQVMDEILDLLE